MTTVAGSTAAPPIATRLVCHGCGYEPPPGIGHPYRCPNGENPDNVDHVLRRVFDDRAYRSANEPRSVFLDNEPNPFRRYRTLFQSYGAARLEGMGDEEYLQIVDGLDEAVREVDGKGFTVTPFTREAALAEAIGLGADDFWVKNETVNVSGSHKARHLMGLAIWLELTRRLQDGGEARHLAIASCGNAALAAAVIAKAAKRPLEVFVPPDANPRILEHLNSLGAETTSCPRQHGDPPGDPCFHRFLDAWKAGALPFTAQAKRNGLTIEGGTTLVWEIVSSLLAEGSELDHLVIQVGGGALATACIEGLKNARALGLIDRLPRIHMVQTQSAYPLRRAYDRLTARLLSEPAPEAGGPHEPDDLRSDNERALGALGRIAPEQVLEAVLYAARHRSEFMWPWEIAPRSLAFGILDDETYDWLAVIEGMLASNGIPVVVSEERIGQAHRLGLAHTEILAEPTGTAGLAGLLRLVESGVVQDGERVAVLFTGIAR